VTGVFTFAPPAEQEGQTITSNELVTSAGVSQTTLTDANGDGVYDIDSTMTVKTLYLKQKTVFSNSVEHLSALITIEI